LPIYGVQFSTSGVRNYDIAPDGSQFITAGTLDVSSDTPRPTQQIQVVLNWFEELKQKVRAK
jgi:hypothetical protein